LILQFAHDRGKRLAAADLDGNRLRSMKWPKEQRVDGKTEKEQGGNEENKEA
jgi:hypothetical protein